MHHITLNYVHMLYLVVDVRNTYVLYYYSWTAMGVGPGASVMDQLIMEVHVDRQSKAVVHLVYVE